MELAKAWGKAVDQMAVGNVKKDQSILPRSIAPGMGSIPLIKTANFGLKEMRQKMPFLGAHTRTFRLFLAGRANYGQLNVKSPPSIDPVN